MESDIPSNEKSRLRDMFIKEKSHPTAFKIIRSLISVKALEYFYTPLANFISIVITYKLFQLNLVTFSVLKNSVTKLSLTRSGLYDFLAMLTVSYLEF